eukprot:SAG31_NODE_3643_length_4030_cov_3.758586_5_plen_72_part_00
MQHHAAVVLEIARTAVAKFSSWLGPLGEKRAAPQPTGLRWDAAVHGRGGADLHLLSPKGAGAPTCPAVSWQ